MTSTPTDSAVRPPLRALVWVLILSLFLLPALAVATGRLHWYQTNLMSLARFLTEAIRSPGADTWVFMEEARQYITADAGFIGVYDAVFFRDDIKLHYPPTSLGPYFVLRAVFDFDVVVRLLNVAGWFCTLGLGVITTMLVLGFRKVRELAGMPVESAVCLVLCLGFFPLVHGQSIGQIQPMLSLLAGLSLLAARDGRDGLAGALVGLCCAFRPQYVLVLLLVALAGRWRVILGAAIAVFMVLSISVAAPGDYLDYFRVVRSMSSTSEAYFTNQSISGAVVRFVGAGDHRQFLMNAYPPASALTSAVSVLVIVGLVVPAVVFGRRASLPVQVALGFVVATISAPIAWEHHYSAILPALGLGVFAALRMRRPRTAWLLAGSFAIASQAIWLVNIQAYSVPKVIAQLPLLLAGLATFALLARLAHLDRGQLGWPDPA